ncbi:urease accessory protein UreE [Pseudorhodobacter wandonensis]|jgi:urease accessory protein|uniref:urease accessory protein UreE n=1 Tax=Pseudorhodobacter wandonensis TaxID=1120568 RepID=UPI00067C8813|nr:urease accessory protein UreE [Pseudorhodobacter wandonensis]
MIGTLSAHIVHRKAGGGLDEQVTLDYAERFLRRKRLVTNTGRTFLIDLAETTSLDDGDALELADGTKIGITAALEPVVKVTGDLPRLAWHIGNRHTPCQICADHLVIRRDHVLEAMLKGLGAELAIAMGPFCPEGGAYGHGRTMGHDHAGHDHGPELGAGIKDHFHAHSYG